MKRVEDVMTGDVITVDPGASIHAAARLMLDHGVGGLPVVDQTGALVGILTDGDLLVRHRPRRRRPWWRLLFAEGEGMALEYRKTAGVTVADAMSSPVITADAGASLESVADLLVRHRIRRVPVVVQGRMCGIVSRGDLIKILAAAPALGGAEPDVRLADDMRARLAAEPWVSNRRLVVEARESVIWLWGQIASDAERAAIETMARTIPGCRGVENHLNVVPGLPYDHQV
jgi:CBS-domain-containing membrane protein